MIIQSSNKPILIKFSEEVLFPNIRITLWNEKNQKLKEWTKEDIKIEGNIAEAPLTQEETANFPKGIAILEIKWLDNDGKTEFANKERINIVDRNDKEIMEVIDNVEDM